MNHLEDQQEWDDLIGQIPLDTGTSDAAALLAELLADAIQARRPWARQRLDGATHSGLTKIWRNHVQAQRPKVKTKKGDVKTVGGVQRVRDDGEAEWIQQPFDTMTFVELSDHRTMLVTQLRASAATVEVIDKLLALEVLCPKAATPSEACERLNLELADVMQDAA